MTLNRRECLRMLALAFTPTPSVVYSERVLDDLWAATEPDAMPALDWGDLSAVMARWGRSTWSHVVTGHHCDLQTKLHDSSTATSQQVSPERPSTVIVVLRGGSGLHLDQCRAVSSAFHSAVAACSELWFVAYYGSYTSKWSFPLIRCYRRTLTLTCLYGSEMDVTT